MDSVHGYKSRGKDTDVSIQKVTMRDENGAAVRFPTGAKAWLDVSIRSKKPVKGLGVLVDLNDDHLYRIFGTSTYRLHNGTFEMDGDVSVVCTFELDLHLAPGLFHIDAKIFNYDEDKFYDAIFKAVTIIVYSDNDSLSAPVNLYPKATITHTQ
jgi:hypothetical protein